MRLRERAPDLPTGEGELYAHESGGDHAIRYSGMEFAYNQLRAAELIPRDARHTDVAGISSTEFNDMLFSDKYEVVIAQQIDASNQPNRLAGLAIGQRKKITTFETRMTVKELVVHPELRRRHIASYMIGRLTQHFSPTELVVATNRFVPEPWFLEGLESAGFRHTSPNGSPSIWLPGSRWSGQGDRNSATFVKNIESHMPEGWNGYGEFYPASDEEDPQTRIYRDGKLKGIIRPIEETDRFDDELVSYVRDFTISDAGDEELDTITGVTEKEARIAVLNAYGLMEEAA